MWQVKGHGVKRRFENFAILEVSGFPAASVWSAAEVVLRTCPEKSGNIA